MTVLCLPIFSLLTVTSPLARLVREMRGGQRDTRFPGSQFSASLSTNEGLFNIFFTVLSLQTCVCLQDLLSPRAPGCLQHQMSSCQRQSKSGKRAGRTSAERPATCSSAISAWESSYKKHLLHFVLSMML